MTRDTYEMLRRLERVGVTAADAQALRRTAMTLHAWHEAVCTDTERDEATGRTYRISPCTGRRYPTPDRETGARKRLAAIMARYPTLSAYVQGDPRGAALYILKPGDVPDGENPEEWYSRGIAVYR